MSYIENNFLSNNTNISLLKLNLYPILIYIFFSFFLALLILFLSYMLIVQNPETEKLSSYECGFEPYEDARQNFDVKFYVVAILFLVFDIETVFLFPWVLNISILDLLSFWVIIDFIIELGIGYIYIWYTNALNW